MRNPTRGNRRTVENNEVADEANFDDLVGIFDGSENSRIKFGCSGATPVDVSALDMPQRNSHPVTRKNYRKEKIKLIYLINYKFSYNCR